MKQPSSRPFLWQSHLMAVLLLATLFVPVLSACGNAEEVESGVPVAQASRVQTTVTVVVPTAAAEEEAGGGGAPAAEATATESPLPSPTPTRALDEAESEVPETVRQLPGIVYRTEDALWQLDATGEAISLSTNSDLSLSPTGDRGLYLADGDVWVVDLNTGEERNVTAESGRTHITAQWWPARPDTLVLTSWGEGEQGPNSGKLTLVEADGSNYRIAHPEGNLSYAQPAPAPDGQTIAYDEAGSAWLYHLDGGAEPFAPAAYLPRDVEVPRIASPSWSSDGDRLAWMMAVQGGEYGNEAGWDIALGVFDLASGTGTIIHPYQTAGRGGWLPPALWSPDGEWLVFSVEATDAEERGLWVTRADGNGQTRLHPNVSAQSFWSPPGDQQWQNGAYLLLAEPGLDNPNAPAWLLTRERWAETPVERPAGAIFVDWRNPESP